jgi:hypothetical protein
MTPKEKAKELFFIFYEIGIDQYDTKQCVLIAVNELIKETGSKFWYDVKREIEIYEF